jgi:hypothetical protein
MKEGLAKIKWGSYFSALTHCGCSGEGEKFTLWNSEAFIPSGRN